MKVSFLNASQSALELVTSSAIMGARVCEGYPQSQDFLRTAKRCPHRERKRRQKPCLGPISAQ